MINSKKGEKTMKKAIQSISFAFVFLMVITSACTPATNTPLTPTPTLTLITPTLLPTDTPLPTKTSVPTKTPILPTATIQAPEQQLEQANKAFRDAVASEMQAAARQAGVKIRTDNFVAIPFDDSSMVFVNAMIEGADRVSIEQLAKGADVLFIYSGAKLGYAENEIDPGFYVVRISQNPASGQWLAQFKNSQGRIVMETEATVERPDSNAAKMQPMCTLGPKGELILFDEHDPFKNITIPPISSKTCPSCVRARFVSQSRTLREAAWQVVKKVAKEPVSIEQVVPVSLGTISLPDYLFVNCGTKTNPDYCDCLKKETGTLPGGGTYSVWSCIGIHSGKWYVFFIY